MMFWREILLIVGTCHLCNVTLTMIHVTGNISSLLSVPVADSTESTGTEGNVTLDDSPLLDDDSVDVDYTVAQTPPPYLCVLLGFQVNGATWCIYI